MNSLKITHTQLSSISLDLGAGDGSVARYLATKFTKVCALDNSLAAHQKFTSVPHLNDKKLSEITAIPQAELNNLNRKIEFRLLDLNVASNINKDENINIAEADFIISIKSLEYLNQDAFEEILTTIINQSKKDTVFVLVVNLLSAEKRSKFMNALTDRNFAISFFAPRTDWQIAYHEVDVNPPKNPTNNIIKAQETLVKKVEPDYEMMVLRKCG